MVILVAANTFVILKTNLMFVCLLSLLLELECCRICSKEIWHFGEKVKKIVWNCFTYGEYRENQTAEKGDQFPVRVEWDNVEITLRQDWLKHEDQNSRLFHEKDNQRKKMNIVFVLLDE